MDTSFEYQAPPSLEDLRQALANGRGDPARTPEDFGRVASLAREAIETGKTPARVTELRVRLAGPGVTGHEMPVRHAAQILDLLQGAVTAIGAASKKLDKAKTPKGAKRTRVGAREATELRIGPYAVPGSLVFTLRANPVTPNEDAFPEFGETDAFVDMAVRKLLTLLAAAESDGEDSIGKLADEIRRYGAMVASKLSKLADETLSADLSLDLGLWATGGGRSASKLSSRGAAAIVAAAERNKSRTESTTLIGRLRTVSDGADQLRLTLDDETNDRIHVDPSVGLGLGSFLGKRVEADVDHVITWKLASGRERSTTTLTEMRLAAKVDELNLDLFSDDTLGNAPA